jgi:hypothetical protein
LAEFRSQYGIPTYNAANLALVRRRIHSLLREHRDTIRGCDLELHVREITAMAFIPSHSDVVLANVLAEDQSILQRAYQILTGSQSVRSRINLLTLPPQ